MKKKKKDFYFTFGFGQPHENCYHVISAETSNEARELMVMRFGSKWAFQYESAEKAGVERFNLKRIY